jgi:hypothetical protein
MKALKLSVILMGVLILVGLAVVAITVAKRANRPGPPAASSQAVPAPAVAPPVAGMPGAAAQPPGFGQVTVRYPGGFEPVETVADGDRLIVRFKSAAGSGRIVILDLRTGRVLGTVTLAPETP